MSTPAVGAILEVSYHSQVPGVQAINVRHYRVSAVTAPGATTAEIAANLSANVGAAMKAVMEDTATYQGARVREIRPVRLDPDTSTVGNGPGGIASELLPPQVCGHLTLRTGFAGRGKRGRIYVPFQPESANTDEGRPSAAHQILLALYGTFHLTTRNVVSGGGGSTTIIPVLYKRSNFTTTDLTTVLARVYWSTQRRRSLVRTDQPVVI